MRRERGNSLNGVQFLLFHTVCLFVIAEWSFSLPQHELLGGTQLEFSSITTRPSPHFRISQFYIVMGETEGVGASMCMDYVPA